MRRRAMLLLASVTVVILVLVLVGCQYIGTLSWMPSDIANYQPPHIGERDGVKVLTVVMFEVGDPTGDSPGEAQLWIEGEKLDQIIEVPGSYSPLYCNAAKDHCLVISGKGKANAASTIMAVGLSDQVDLTKAYILVAGIAGTQPDDGTIGTAAWAEWVVDGDLAHEIDARDMPINWSYSYFHLGCDEPWCDDGWTTGTEVYHLNPSLTEWAYRLSRDVELADSEKARSYRLNFPEGTAARRAPFVTKGDSYASDTYWQGKILSDCGEWWTKQFTGGQGNYCMNAMEDIGTRTALSRLAAAGRVDLNRVMILRTASDFDQPYPGQTTLQSLQADSGGDMLAIQNAYRVGSVVADHIITHWDEWKDGVPPLP
jgi:purine nucleoside permease